MRLFVAVWPPTAVVARLAALERPPIEGVRWTAPDQWHVTLRFLGEVEDESPIVEALDRVSLPGATAVIGPSAVRLGHHILALPVTGLDDLAAVVEAVTADIGDPPDHRPFQGHLTLARSRRPVRPGTLDGLVTAEVAGTWKVEVVTVVASRLSTGAAEGSRYDVVANAPVA